MHTTPVLSPDARTWLWPDGTVLPVVSGAQEAVAPEAPAATPEAPAPDAPEPAEAEAPPPADDDTFYEGWPEQAVKAHRDLKSENVRYKERFRPFEETFGALHESDRDFLLGFTEAFRSGDTAALSQYEPGLRAFLDSLNPAERAEAVDAIEKVTGAEEEEWDPFKRESIEEIAERKARELIDARDAEHAKVQQERDREAAVAAARKDIESAAKALSDEHGVPEWADPTSAMFRALVSVAQSVEGETTLEGRMGKAAERLSGELDKRAQALLKAKSAEAGEAPAPQGGTEPSGRKVPRDLTEATESAMRRLEALQRGPTGN